MSETKGSSTSSGCLRRGFLSLKRKSPRFTSTEEPKVRFSVLVGTTQVARFELADRDRDSPDGYKDAGGSPAGRDLDPSGPSSRSSSAPRRNPGRARADAAKVETLARRPAVQNAPSLPKARDRRLSHMAHFSNNLSSLRARFSSVYGTGPSSTRPTFCVCIGRRAIAALGSDP